MDNATTNGSLQAYTPPPREVRVVHDTIDLLDTARFEHLQRVCSVLAASTLVPDSFRFEKMDGRDEPLSERQITANVFMVVDIAVRWGLSPTQVLGGASIVHGKLCFEGKIIHAAIKSKLGIDLKYTFTGNDRQTKVTVTGTLPGETTARDVEGTVDQWHKGPKSPWANPLDWPRQLRYRGAREWCRAHSPGVILGAYGDDEFEDLREDRRATRDITPATAALAPPPPPPFIRPTTATQADWDSAAPKQAEPEEPKKPGPPALPAHLRSAGEKPAADSGKTDGPAAGTKSQERAPATPTPSPERVTGATGDGELTYVQKFEHEILCCETADEMKLAWGKHKTKVALGGLTEAEQKAAADIYESTLAILTGDDA